MYKWYLDQRHDDGICYLKGLIYLFQDEDTLLHELHRVRYFDVFELNAAQKYWGCFLCNHPEKVSGLLQDGYPAIEGQLKEKKGRWKIFKRWKTRYFTLSGATITYNKKDSVSTQLCYNCFFV